MFHYRLEVAITVLESFNKKKKIRGLTSVVAVGHKTLTHHDLEVNPAARIVIWQL